MRQGRLSFVRLCFRRLSNLRVEGAEDLVLTDDNRSALEHEHRDGLGARDP
jgi:hypothetical protein